jgi:single-strand DNA-binding protein
MKKVILIGNLTRDPELSTTATGISVCKIGIAVNRPFKNSEGITEVDFFNIIAWRTQAENCAKFLRKGLKVCVVGSLQNRSYEGQDGQKKYVTEIVAENVEFLSPKGSDGIKSDNTIEPINDDILPF